MTTLILAILIFTSYTIVIGMRYGILSSLSNSYYALGKNGWIFQLVLALTAVLVMVSLFEITEGYWFQFLSFFTAAPLLFTAAAPRYKNPDGHSIESGVHGKSATLAGGSSIILLVLMSIYIDSTVWLSLVVGGLYGFVGYILNGRNNKIYWLEYVCFVALLSALWKIYF